jgi:trehalose synthase
MAMLQSVDVGERSLDAYRGVAPEATIEALRRLAADLRGARVLHINATPYGGGVSELLRSTVPLLNDLGLVADWRIISGDEAFFEATKAIHNALQGAPKGITGAQRDAYLANARRNAAELQERYDFVFVHDPQPAALLPLHGKDDAHWIWRCHIDTSEPNPAVWAFLRDQLADYDAAVFTMRDFVAPDIPVARVEIIPPAIDPLSPKNLDLPESTAREVLEWIGVHPERPLVTQVSRFDPWKDPLGVIAAYRLAREQVPGLQLVLAGSMALDDPEGWRIYRQISDETRADPKIRLLTNLTGVGNVEVNALQRLSDVIVQKSLREGFGLVISEALWKGTPVVAGRAGGIPLQMADGVGGTLVDGVEECAAAIAALFADPEGARGLAERGRERVRQHFLTPRLVLDELNLMTALASGSAPRVEDTQASDRDPVCEMTITDPHPLWATHGGRRYAFCSETCRLRFLEEPARFVGLANAGT